MSKLYLLGCVLMGAGAGCMYLAGIRDATGKTWEEAVSDADDSPMGSVGDVRGKRDRGGSPGDAA